MVCPRTIAKTGNIYFQDHDETGVDIYLSRLIDGNYTPPEKLSEAINSRYPEIGPWVSPDESILWFSSDRPDGYGSMDIYYSKRDSIGNWLKAINAGEIINSPYGDAIPTISPDGKHQFFLSFRPMKVEQLKGKNYQEIFKLLNSPENGDGTIFWLTTF